MSYFFFFQVLRIYALLSACISATSNIVPQIDGLDDEWPSVPHVDAVSGEMTSHHIVMKTAQGEKKCFDGFGCFEVGNNFTHPLGLPSSPDYIGASTWLYSRGRYGTNPKEIDFRTVSSLEDMRELQTNKPLFILIHGYRRSRKHIWISETIIALLAKWFAGLPAVRGIPCSPDTEPPSSPCAVGHITLSRKLEH
uniref:Putative phospholipase n=1 Tax=Ixodes scapularis TaxID=6945 RepID=A0A4D5RUB6_IXOSC